ncbi:hypothetical protein IWQ61_009277, partial [Dispira simplex]
LLGRIHTLLRRPLTSVSTLIRCHESKCAFHTHRTHWQRRSRLDPVECPKSPGKVADPAASSRPNVVSDVLSAVKAKTDPGLSLAEKERLKRRSLLYADKIFRKHAYFLLSATKLGQINHLVAPEVVFLGRSNVGKSSLINALFNRRQLVKTSKKPGHTSKMNFFSLGSIVPQATVLTLVDMPGYGYRSRLQWGSFITDYLRGRKRLRSVYLLIDANVAELKQTDEQCIDMMNDLQLPFRIVLTKVDKVRDTDAVVGKITQLVQDRASFFVPPVLPVSAVLKYELAELRLNILITCGIVKPPY